jgi:ELWxxDGT repeat protein
VLWDGTGLTTQFDTATQLEAQVPADLLAQEGSATVSVTEDNGSSGSLPFTITGTGPAVAALVKDINPGLASSYPLFPTNVNGTLFFAANDGSHGVELWQSNGTSSGTALVKDILPGSAGSDPSYLTNVNGTLFFQASDGSNGEELWKSDGTSSGTVLVSDINPGSAGSDPSALTNVNGTLFFEANDGSQGKELWQSNGTSSGTALLKDIDHGFFGSFPKYLTNVGGTLFFRADDGSHGTELWQSNGTSTGTALLADGFFHSSNGLYLTSYLNNVNGTLFFAANDGTPGGELWKSDGSSAGTAMVAKINPGSIGSYPKYLTNVNGILFFSAVDQTHGRELWQSDGTSSGTVLVADINPGSPSSNPGGLANANGTLFFAAQDGVHGYELWMLASATAPAAGSLAVSGFPSGNQAGASASFKVTALNADGTLATGYTGTVVFSSSDAKVALPAKYTFTAADAGSHTFSATLYTAGTRSITATDTTTAGLTGTDGGITVQPAAASQLVVSGFPSATTAGAAHTFVVTAEDAYGNIATDYAGTVHFTSSDAKATLPSNYTFTAADAGKHTFSATLFTADTQSISATDTTTASISGTDSGITVKPAAASKFVLTGPSSVTAGVPFRLTLTVVDAYGNVVTGYLGTVHFSSTDGTAVLPANYTFSATDQGVHTFTGLVLHRKGQQKVTVTDTLNSSLTASLTEQVA